MSYVDEYRKMVSTSNVIVQASNDTPFKVFSYPSPEDGWDMWQKDYETVIFTEDDDWLENDCAG
jgi:hypothetical protein